MHNSIVLEKLETLDVKKIKSAIIIMDGTELYDNPKYKTAKKKFEQDQDCTTFVDIVKPLYIALGDRYGFELN